jgi:cysteine-rich repeat protein
LQRISKRKTKKNIDVRNVLSQIIGICIAFVIITNVFAQSGSSTSYDLNFQQDGYRATSSSYSVCSKFPSVGSLGSSSSYSVTPAVHCPDAVAPPVVCGNAIIDVGEVCDGANLGAVTSCADLGQNSGTPSCNITCTQIVGCYQTTTGGGGGGGGEPPTHGTPVEPYCGDGIKQVNEQCDDGNNLSYDGCGSTCTIELTAPPVTTQCGNGIREINEQCDDGNTTNGDGCSSVCSVEHAAPPEVFIPAAIPTPSAPPVQPKEIPDFIFITNDITPLLFGKFIDSDNYTVTFRDKTGYTTVTINALDEFLSFESENELPEGIYDVSVIDNVDPTKQAYLQIKVDTNEPILSPVIDVLEAYEFTDQNFEGKVYDILDTLPIIKGHTDRHAFIGVYDVRDRLVKVLETDENNNFEFIPSRVLSAGNGEFRFVALYEDRLSKEVRIRYRIPEVCGTCVLLGHDYPNWVCVVLILLALAWIIYFVWHYCSRKPVREVQPKVLRKAPSARNGILRFFVVLLSLLLIAPHAVRAVETTPAFFIYNGILKTPGGVPVTTAQSFRFSLWTSDDFVDGVDRNGAGALLTPGTYAGWKEVQTVTPDTSGYFEIKVGATSADPWPNFNKDAHPYLMIEVKPSASADTAYEVIDPNTASAIDDRHDIGNEPFARNSDYLDNKEIGLSADNIVVLDGTAHFPIATIPGGTNFTTFNIDADDPDDTTGIIGLYFGTTLANHFLSWDPDGVAVGDGWFNFNDDVNIDGDLTVTGSITGSIDYSNLVPRSKSLTLIPEYDGATVEQDGTANKGSLKIGFEDLGGVDKRNYYEWTTQQVGSNDVDVAIKIRIPLDFVSFDATPFELLYQTSDAVVATNDLDITLFDTTGTAVALTGGTDLASASWSTAGITTGGAPTFTAGGEITLRIKLSSIGGGFARAGTLRMNYTGR